MSQASIKNDTQTTRLSHGSFSTARVRYRFDSKDPSFQSSAALIKRDLGVSAVTAKLLVSRGLTTPEEARSFLNPTLKTDLPDPTKILNAARAAELILDAVEAKERITIFHDFDVDGLTAGAQLGQFLLKLGANVQCFVPNRFVDGYGLSIPALERLIQQGTEMLITVDCGISNVKEIAFARSKGVKTIIIDHHEPSELPEADVIVDPAQTGCAFQEYRLAAAGLVWMLLIVIRAQAKMRFADQIARAEISLPDVKEFLDLAAIGTICDMVPLNKLNRIIAHRGIEALRTTSRVGLIALKEVAGVTNSARFGCGQVAFGLGPRINAAGRLDDASQAAILLSTEDPERAQGLAQKIDGLNSERRAVEEEVRTRCIDLLLNDSLQLNQPAFAIFQEDFHLGVIGIAAQRLVEEFHKPSAVMGLGETEISGKKVAVAKGSVRSIEGFHIAEVLHGMSDILLAGGGHAQAGGFTVALDRVDEFRAAFIQAARDTLTPELLQRTQKADLRVSFSEVDFALVEELQRLAPFGIGNPSPVLVTESVYVESVTALSGKHLRLRLREGGAVRNAVAWNMLGHPLLRKGAKVSIAYQAELNSYQGVASVQLSLKLAWDPASVAKHDNSHSNIDVP